MTFGPQLPPLQTRHNAAQWLHGRGQATSPLGERAAAVLGVVYRGIYNAPLTASTWDGQPFAHPHFVQVSVYGELATFDADGLTRLVCAAHDAAVRVSVRPASNRTFRLGFAARDREGSEVHQRLYDRHPRLEEAVARVRRAAYEVPTHAVTEDPVRAAALAACRALLTAERVPPEEERYEGDHHAAVEAARAALRLAGDPLADAYGFDRGGDE
jgi:hypothetical protein